MIRLSSVRGLAAIAALACAPACDRGHPREGTGPGSVPGTAAEPVVAVGSATPGACHLSPALPLRRSQPTRLVAIGDLHGDLAATKSALKAAGAIDDTGAWIGGDLVVVQTGDVLDRGDDEQAIFDFLFALEDKARASGGELILLIGNHELMNAAGDYRYVTPASRDAFGGRAAALGPGGPYAKKIAQHAVVAIVGDTVFSHAGPVGPYATQLEAINDTARCWLDGQLGGPDANIPANAEDSPVWTRAYGSDQVDCAAATAAMKAMDVKRIVVGHTVQEKINSACDGTVWRIDVGLAKLYGGPIEVLEVYPTPRVLHGTR